MRSLAAALVVGLCVNAPASAQNESVIVIGQSSLTGFWKTTLPPGNSFCRFVQKGSNLSARCLNWTGKVSGSVDNDKIHLAMPCLHFLGPDCPTAPGAWVTADVSLISSTEFRGQWGIKMIGLHLTERNGEKPNFTAVGHKVETAKSSPENDETVKLLEATIAELASGGIKRPHATAIAANISGDAPENSSREMRDLSAVLSAAYLGTASRLRGKWQLETKTWSEPAFVYSIYAVEFTNGQRLCGIHQRDDGVLDGFLCV